MKAIELKNKYLDFFKGKEHAIVPSASLVPVNDSSVLFITAGMQPMVPYLMGQTHPQGKRIADIQKCLRTVDFENIGDNTHHTFFLMLGNWSLGDYFKEDMIKWSFEFLTKTLNLPLDKLAFTCYQGDDKIPKDEVSYNLWKSQGVSEERIAYLGEDNFWIAGDTGPCGPSSEMFYWTGDNPAPKTFDPEDETWVEIWNDVFMAYNKKDENTIEPLENKNVDTGMGFERTLAVLTGKKSAYETDLFQPIIKEIEKLSNQKYFFTPGDLGYDKEPECWKENVKAMRIIADHIRAATFILGDGSNVKPSNVDRGYILRRLIRRAIRFGKQLGIQDPFMPRLAREVIETYKDMFPELEENQELIRSELHKEEQRFEATLEKGLREFEKMSTKDLSGQETFLLFQSYGFPLEMTEELADEKGIKVDTEGFFAEYEKHQQASKKGAEQKFKGGLADLSEDTIKLHTATHLLNEALRKVISPEIKQRGSNITPERLRFDFNFDRKLTKEEQQKVEDEVNRVIQAALTVERKEMPKEEALKVGAQMEFGQNYPGTVSVYFIGDYSKEFCGGPHVENTKDIGHFKIIKEQSSAAGVRRIKAVVSSEPRS